MRHLEIDNLAISADGAAVSFTARLHSHGASTTVASYARLNCRKATEADIHRLIERRVAKLMERPSPSGRPL